MSARTIRPGAGASGSPLRGAVRPGPEILRLGASLVSKSLGQAQSRRHDMLFHGGKPDAVIGSDLFLLHALKPEKNENILGPLAQLVQTSQNLDEVLLGY